MMTTDRIGLYVHVPFCKSKCNYCDFVSFGTAAAEYEKAYVDALISEISEYERKAKIKADTVFFGGGTPSIISADSFSKICDALRKAFDISALSEFSIEVNPKTVSMDKLRLYKAHGVNRISIGLQSANENELKILGRIHNYNDFLDSYNLIRECGFDNVNVDIMYGIPEQTKKSFLSTLKNVVALRPEHISAYGLILEEGTPLFNKRDSLIFPTEDEEIAMYEAMTALLFAEGYSHYEISNYSRKGFSCKHNLKYWRDMNYIGLGLAAHSYFEGKRYSNTVDLSEYFSSDRVQYRTVEEISESDSRIEYVMLALRLSEGISLSDYQERFSKSFFEGREALIDKFIGAGYMKIENGRISLTESGFYVSNSILSELL